MSDQIFFDGVRYVSANEAASSAGFSRDYIARLCREAKLKARRVGKNWYVEHTSLQSFLVDSEYQRSLRSQRLTRERVHEYHDKLAADPAFKVAKVRASKQTPLPSAATAGVVDIRERLDQALARGAPQVLENVKGYVNAPSGITHAALQATHVPLYTVTPFMEFAHKLIALTLAFMLTFGTYALVDPAYAKFATDTVSEQIASAGSAYDSATGGGLNAMADRAQTQVAAAAADPAGTFASARVDMTASAASTLQGLARAVNSGIDSMVYAIAFPPSLISSVSFVDTSGRGSVAVEVSPYAPGAASITPAASSTRIVYEHAAPSAPAQVIEHDVVTQQLVSAGGITEQELDQKINELDNKLTSEIMSVSASVPPFSGPPTSSVVSTQVVAQETTIDKLENTTIKSPTITGGSISGADISATSLSAGTTTLSNTTINGALAVIGTSTLATTTVGGDLTVTGNETVEGSLVIPGALTISSSTISLLTSTYATTSFISAVTASTTDLTWVNATGTNTVLTNATSTNFFATNASTTNATSTNLFAAVSNFTSSVIGTLNAAIAVITNLTATNLVATNATTTNATTTNLALTGTGANEILSTNGNGSVVATSTPTANNFIATLASATSSFAGGITGPNNFTVQENSGWVGIGTTSPSQALSVNGNFYLSGNATTSALYSTTASSTNLFAENASFGSLSLGGTSISGLAVFGNGLISQASSTIGNGTQTGGLTVFGGATTTGNQYISGNLTVAGNSVTLGNSSSNSLTVNSSIDSDLVPSRNITYNLGSPSFYWNNAYIGNLNANNISAASTSIGGTTDNTFTINSGNATADTENSSLIFFRGTVVPNAVLTWNSSTKRFEFNQATYIQNESGSTTEPTFTLQGVSGQTGDLFDIASSSGANLFSISANGTTNIGGSLTVQGSLTSTQQSSSTLFSSYGPAYFGSTATSTFNTLGQLTLNTTNTAASSLLATNQNGLVIASSTIGWNLLKGPASSIFAFDASGNPIATTSIGVGYLAGVLPTNHGGTGTSTWQSGSIPYFNGANFTENNGGLKWDSTNSILDVSALVAAASSTIGNGTQTGGLTISGGATTTGNAYFAGTISNSVITLNGGTISTGGNNTLYLSPGGSGGVNASVGNANFTVGTGGGSGSFVFNTSGGNAQFNGGNVGIGTTTPGTLLSLAGLSPEITIESTGNGGASIALVNSNRTGPITGPNTGTWNLLNRTGQFGQFSIAYTPQGGSISSDYLSIATSTGNIGIGTTSPSQALSVNGNSYLTGGLGVGLVNTSAGSIQTSGNLTVNGQQITSDGSGASMRLISPAGIFLEPSNSGLKTDFSSGSGACESGSSFCFNGTGLGIGNTSPSALLDLGSTVTTIKAAVYDSGGSNIYGLGVNSGELTFGAGLSSVSGTPQMVLTNGGNVGIGTTSPGTLLSLAGTSGIVASTTATSTFIGGGINLVTAAGNTGCYAINGTCLSAYTGTGILGAGTLGQVAYFSGTNAAVGTSTLFISSASNLGVGTTSPWARLAVWGADALGSQAFAVANSASTTLLSVLDSGTTFVGTSSVSTAASLFVTATTSQNGSNSVFTVASSTGASLVTILGNGNVGIGTTSPTANLTVAATLSGGIKDLFHLTNMASATSTGSQLSLRQIDVYGNSTTTGAIGSILTQNYGQGGGALTFSTLNSGSLAEAARIISNGNFGIGTTTPWANLSVTSKSQQSGGSSLLSVASTTGAQLFNVLGNGTVGIGTSDPTLGGIVGMLGSGIGIDTNFTGAGTVLAIASSTSNTTSRIFALNQNTRGGWTLFDGSAAGNAWDAGVSQLNGNVGIGTTSPTNILSVTQPTSGGQLNLSYDAGDITQFLTNSVGSLNIVPSGNNTYLPNSNLWVCTGGSLSTNACPSGTPAGQGNIIVQNRIGIGTSTPVGLLTIHDGSAADLVIDSGFSNAGYPYISTAGGAFGSQDSMVFNVPTGKGFEFAENNADKVDIDTSGNLLVGTTTAQVTGETVQNKLYVANGYPSAMGTATSTFLGDIKITGKLDVPTIDPVYTIDGTKYATYGESATGEHEETLQTIELTQKDPTTGKYVYAINFDAEPKGSDLWLFWQITDFGDNWQGLVVELTPAFDGTAFYQKVPSKDELLVEADQPGEVSMRLSGDRFDFSHWGNVRPDQGDKSYEGFQLSSKPAAQTAAAGATR